MEPFSDALQSGLPADVHLCPSATKLTGAMRAGVVVCGSHGGRYPGFLAAEAGLRGIILCDAGVGLDEAGIASLPLLERIGMAAATVSSAGCRIGDAEDMARRGVISFANATALELGVRPGQKALEAAAIMTTVPEPAGKLDMTIGEGRSVLRRANGRNVVLIDSASLVQPEDAGQVIVTGSHGGLVGGVPAMALQVVGHAAFFNDAGIGADKAGFSRLPALDARGIAAVTVSAASAHIGEARSTFDDGVVSFCNETARRLGAASGMRAKHLVERLAGR